MLNYMKSEFYRTFRNRNLGILLCACALLMTALVFVLKYFGADTSFPYANTKFALSNVYGQMNLFLMATIIFSGFIHDNEERHHTIKHSVAFGIKRSKIYLGRFLVQAVVSILIYIVVVGCFTALSYAMLSHKNVGEMQNLIRVSLGSITCLMTALAVTHFFLMSSENQNTAYVWAIIILALIPAICNMLGRKVELIRRMAELFPINVISDSGALVLAEGMGQMEIINGLLIGAIWLAMFLILGIYKFNSREVK